MAVIVVKKNNAGRRNMSVLRHDYVTDKAPEKSLSCALKNKAGRSKGKISVRHRGGGTKKKYRMIDFKMDKFDVPGKIVAIEKDPNRSALIALVSFADGEKRYVVATNGMRKGMDFVVSKKAPIKEGNRMELRNIPVGTEVSSIEMVPGKGAQLARSAGSVAILQAIDGGMATLKMPSGEIRMVKDDCLATLGRVSNLEHGSVRIGKAGKKRHLGRRPYVRGSAMNPVDHPHGGGEGRQPIGLKYPKTPWGKPALGKKTRKGKNMSDRLIIKRRKTKKR